MEAEVKVTLTQDVKNLKVIQNSQIYINVYYGEEL